MRKLLSFFAFVLMGAGLLAAPAPAQAAPVQWSYAAATGATLVKVANGTITSDLTAQSGVTGGAKSSTSKNSTAAINIDGLASVGAIETKTDATVNPTNTTLKSYARVAGVNLLGGLITADVAETNVTTIGYNQTGTGTHTANSRLANIKIAGIKLPLNIPKNYAVNIPGVASVTLNYTIHGKVDRTVGTLGWAIGVTLLQPRGQYDAGVTLLVNPVNHYLSEVDPSEGAGLWGTAYGSRVDAHVTDGITVISDPTARVITPVGSSNGRTLTNSTLSVRVPGVLTTGVITSTSTSTKDAFGNAEITNTNQTARINVLSGLIKADAIKVTARGKLEDGKWTSEMNMTFVNLEIAGQKIPINISPNTIIDVAGLGEVALNRQQVAPNGSYMNRIDGLRITLDTEQAGLPIGAVIEFGVAATAIAPAGTY